MRLLKSATRTGKARLLEVIRLIIERNLLPLPNIPHSLKQHHLPLPHKFAPRLQIRLTARVHESRPIPGLFGVHGGSPGNLEPVHALIGSGERTEEADVLVEIGALFDAAAGLDVGAVACFGVGAADFDLGGEEGFLEGFVAGCVALQTPP